MNRTDPQQYDASNSLYLSSDRVLFCIEAVALLAVIGGLLWLAL